MLGSKLSSAALVELRPIALQPIPVSAVKAEAAPNLPADAVPSSLTTAQMPIHSSQQQAALLLAEMAELRHGCQDATQCQVAKGGVNVLPAEPLLSVFAVWSSNKHICK